MLRNTGVSVFRNSGKHGRINCGTGNCDKRRGSDGYQNTPESYWTDITGPERDPVRVTFLVVTKAIKASSQLEGTPSARLPGRMARRQKHEWLVTLRPQSGS